jgi:hypothetical protein
MKYKYVTVSLHLLEILNLSILVQHKLRGYKKMNYMARKI